MTSYDLEVFQELVLEATSDGTSAIRSSLLMHIASNWQHDEAKEQDLMAHGSQSGEDIMVFLRKPDEKAPSVGLVLWQEKNGYKVVNIVPQESGELSISQYNAVLQDFVKHIVEPAALDKKFCVEVSKPWRAIQDWLGETPAAMLRKFSGAANKSSGASHPKDQERWQDFLIAVHKSGHREDPELLRRWLIDIEHWPEEIASNLSASYETALELLQRYDNYSFR